MIVNDFNTTLSNANFPPTIHGPTQQSVKWEYEYDERGYRVILGRGTYGVVYSARDVDTHTLVSVVVGVCVFEVCEWCMCHRAIAWLPR